MRTILVATGNVGKMRELAAMLEADVRWVSLADVGDVEPVEEDGATFAENARKKAVGYARQTGLWTLADDSGLAVDALEGRPGVFSARYAGLDREGVGRDAVDRANWRKVLDEMADAPDERRGARFVCRLCLASGEEVLAESEGTVEGRIARAPAGENGFGYDPIFFVPEAGKTAAEMTPEEKNAISHRGKAIAAIRGRLLELVRE